MAELKLLPCLSRRAWLLALALAGAPVAHAADELVLGVLDNSPPMSFRDARGEYSGYSIDMARALCKELGRHCRFV